LNEIVSHERTYQFLLVNQQEGGEFTDIYVVSFQQKT